MARPKDRPTIKDDSLYEALRKEGYGKEKAARIANTDNPGKKGGEAEDYEDRTREELYAKAREIGLEGRSHKTKAELIKMLRGNKR